MDLNDLAHRIRRGDKEAMRQLVEAYGGEIYRKALQKCGDPELAKEATRQTFRQIVTGLQTNTDESGWQLWIDMLAKTNISTYSTIATDIAVMEAELERDLRLQQEKGILSDQPSQPPRVLNTVFAQVPILSGIPFVPRSYDSPSVPQSVPPTSGPVSPPVQIIIEPDDPLPQTPAAPQTEQAPHPRQQPAPDASPQPDHGPEPLHTYPRPQQGPLPERNVQHVSNRKGKNKPSRHSKKAPVRPAEDLGFEKPGQDGRTLLIVVLILFCCVLVWVMAGIAMSMGLVPKLELGYDWFNQHLFKLF